MTLLRKLADGLRSLFRKAEVCQELDEELDGFLEMAVQEKMKSGMPRADALRAVRLERGTTEITREIVLSAGWGFFVETCWRDLCFGVRVLRKTPGFTVVAILTLALGIGAVTTIFSIVDTILLKPLAYKEPGEALCGCGIRGKICCDLSAAPGERGSLPVVAGTVPVL